MPTHCSAFGCANSSRKESCKNRGISFHKFPLADKMLVGRWLVNVRRADFQPTPYSYICSDHFAEEDFEYQPFTNRRGLKKGAVPTRFSYSNKPSNRKKLGISRNNQSPEMHDEDYACEPVIVGNDMESNEIHCALVEISMNEKFYSPEQLEALTNDLPSSTRSKQKNSHALSEKIVSLKESLHAKILLRSLKKQLLNSEIKAANAKRDYYEAKQTMLSQTADVLDSDESSETETESPLQKIKSRLEEEELAAQIEERVLLEQLEEVKMQAANYEKEYHEAKSCMLSFN